jgi:hypothetical protein
LNGFQGEESHAEQSRANRFFILIPTFAFANPKGKQAVALHVVTSNARIRGPSSNNVFAYTDLVFTQLNGKKEVYPCVHHGKVSTMLKSGKTYGYTR